MTFHLITYQLCPLVQITVSQSKWCQISPNFDITTNPAKIVALPVRSTKRFNLRLSLPIREGIYLPSRGKYLITVLGVLSSPATCSISPPKTTRVRNSLTSAWEIMIMPKAKGQAHESSKFLLTTSTCRPLERFAFRCSQPASFVVVKAFICNQIDPSMGLHHVLRLTQEPGLEFLKVIH